MPITGPHSHMLQWRIWLVNPRRPRAPESYTLLERIQWATMVRGWQQVREMVRNPIK